MPITPEQLERRKSHIGSSDISSILGINPWRNAADLWVEKTGRLNASPSSEAANDGNKLEDLVLDYAEEKLGQLRRNITIPWPDCPIIESNLDAQRINGAEPVEGKTTGINGPVVGEWGEDGTDQIPDYYIAQCTVHLAVTGAEVCFVPAWIGGRGKFIYEVRRNERVIEAIKEKALEFWDYVKRDICPPDISPSIETIKLMKREPKKIISIPPNLFTAWEDTKKAAEVAEAEADAAKKALLLSLGDAEAGEVDGKVKVTFYEQSRKGSQKSAWDYIQANHPEVSKEADRLIPMTSFRVLREKKGK
jgi:putative phage-type endonuclease